jgi:hypothetical protein
MIADGDTPDAWALHHLRRMEQSGPASLFFPCNPPP